MAYKTVRAQCPHDNKQDPKKPYWQDVGKFLLDDETFEWMAARGKRITFFPSFVPGASYSATVKEWDNDKKDDPGDGKGGKW